MVKMYGVFVGVELLGSFDKFTEAYQFAINLREKGINVKIYMIQEIGNW